MINIGRKLKTSIFAILLVIISFETAFAQNYSKEQIKSAKKTIGMWDKGIKDLENGIHIENAGYYYSKRAYLRVVLGDYTGALDDTFKGLDAISKNANLSSYESKNLTIDLLLSRALAKEYSGHPKREIYDEYMAIYSNAKYLIPEDANSIIYNQLKPIGKKLNNLSTDLYLIDLNADYAKHPENKAIFDSAIAKTNVGDHEGAVKEYDKAILNSPDFYLYYTVRGYQKSALKDRENAILDFKKAISLSNGAEDGWLYKALGFEYEHIGKYAQSLKELDTALKKNPWDTNIRVSRVNVMAELEKEQHPTAYAKYQSATDKIAKAKVTEFSQRNAIYESALSDIDDAIRISPNASFYYSQKIEASILPYPSKEDPNTLIAAANKAYQLDPESVLNMFYVAKIYWYYGWSQGENSGNLPRSLKYLYLASLYAPDDKEITEKIGSVQDAYAKGSYEHQAQVAADNAFAAQKREKEEKAREEAAKNKAPDFNDKMQAWCDSIGASGMTNMAAVPPACYGYIRKH